MPYIDEVYGWPRNQYWWPSDALTTIANRKMGSISMQVRAVGNTIGSEIIGLDLTSKLSLDVRKSIYELWVDRGVLVFRDQKLEAAQLVAAAEIFGKVMSQQLSKFSHPDHPAVGVLTNRDLPTVDGKVHVRGENYHTDHSNFAKPPKATMVHIIDLPSRGGDTQFVDVRAAYDDLPADMKGKIAKLKSLHVYESSNSPRKMAALTPEELAEMPSTLQPVVIRHPDSGRPAVYLNTARMEGIEGLGPEEANALIARLFDHSTKAKYEYRHVYKKGDVVIWDNRSVMHQANADVDPSELRRLHRVIVAGDQLEAYGFAGELVGSAA